MRNADFSIPWEASNASLHQNCWRDWTLRLSQKIYSYFPATTSFLLELETEPKIPKQIIWPLLLAVRALDTFIALLPEPSHTQFPIIGAPHLLVRCSHLVMDPWFGIIFPFTNLLPGMATRLHPLANWSYLPFVKKPNFVHLEYFMFSITWELASIRHLDTVFTKKDAGILYNEQGDLYSNASKLYIT